MAPDMPANLRRVTIKAMTDAGWIAGTLFVPSAARLADYMERAPSFLPLSDVFMQAHSKRLPFFAVQQSAIEFIAVEGAEDSSSVEDTQIMEDHSISCLMAKGMLKGIIAVKPGFRLSDYLAKHHRFIPIKDCTFRVRGQQSESVDEESSPFILVNSERVIGVTERSNPGDVSE